MSSDGSDTLSTLSKIRQFGLYRTVDERTEEFLRLSKRKQLKQGCICAAISTAVTVTLVIVILLVYNYDKTITKSEKRFVRIGGAMKSKYFDENNNGKSGTVSKNISMLPKFIKTLRHNNYLGRLLNETVPKKVKSNHRTNAITQNKKLDAQKILMYSLIDEKSPLHSTSNVNLLNYYTELRKLKQDKRIFHPFNNLIYKQINYDNIIPQQTFKITNAQINGDREISQFANINHKELFNEKELTTVYNMCYSCPKLMNDIIKKCSKCVKLRITGAHSNKKKTSPRNDHKTEQISKHRSPFYNNSTKAGNKNAYYKTKIFVVSNNVEKLQKMAISKKGTTKQNEPIFQYNINFNDTNNDSMNFGTDGQQWMDITSFLANMKPANNFKRKHMIVVKYKTNKNVHDKYLSYKSRFPYNVYKMKVNKLYIEENSTTTQSLPEVITINIITNQSKVNIEKAGKQPSHMVNVTLKNVQAASKKKSAIPDISNKTHNNQSIKEHNLSKDYNDTKKEYNITNKVYNQTIKQCNHTNKEYNKVNKTYNKANTEYNKANTEYNKANTEYNKANTEYNKANTEYNKANTEYNKANTGYNRANIDFQYESLGSDNRVFENILDEVYDVIKNDFSPIPTPKKPELDFDAKLKRYRSQSLLPTKNRKTTQRINNFQEPAEMIKNKHNPKYSEPEAVIYESNDEQNINNELDNMITESMTEFSLQKPYISRNNWWQELSFLKK